MLRGMKGSITKQLVYKTWVAVYDAYKLQELCMITYFGLFSAHSHNTIKKLLISCTFIFVFGLFFAITIPLHVTTVGNINLLEVGHG